MVKNRYYGNEGLGLAWDCIEVFYVVLFITTTGSILYMAGKTWSKVQPVKVFTKYLQNTFL